MLRTIQIGKFTSVQGTYLKTLANGLMQVRVGDRIHTGRPVNQAAQAITTMETMKGDASSEASPLIRQIC
jgi:hypothetical protein